MRRAPGDNVLPDQFQTVDAVLSSDWCQKNTSFLAPIRRQISCNSFELFSISHWGFLETVHLYGCLGGILAKIRIFRNDLSFEFLEDRAILMAATIYIYIYIYPYLLQRRNAITMI